eukprot:Em0005g962a
MSHCLRQVSTLSRTPLQRSYDTLALTSLRANMTVIGLMAAPKIQLKSVRSMQRNTPGLLDRRIGPKDMFIVLLYIRVNEFHTVVDWEAAAAVNQLEEPLTTDFAGNCSLFHGAIQRHNDAFHLPIRAHHFLLVTKPLQSRESFQYMPTTGEYHHFSQTQHVTTNWISKSLIVVMGEIVAHFHLNTYVCTPTGLHQDISDLVVAGDHISAVFAGDCMVAKVIKYTGAQGTLGVL